MPTMMVCRMHLTPLWIDEWMPRCTDASMGLVVPCQFHTEMTSIVQDW
jgi:hypothetical protein